MVQKYISLEGLQIYHKNLKKYIDMKIGIEVHGKTNCPNCAAIIDNTEECKYCGTRFSFWF